MFSSLVIETRRATILFRRLLPVPACGTEEHSPGEAGSPAPVGARIGEAGSWVGADFEFRVVLTDDTRARRREPEHNGAHQ